MFAIDSHIHIGPSHALGIHVSVERVKKEMENAGVGKAAIMPFPSYAENGDEANRMVLEICRKHDEFLPIFCLNAHLPKPSSEFVAVKWHWVGGVSDLSSNYRTLEREDLPKFVDYVADLSLPLIFEEELDFTKQFVDKFPELTLIIPHLGGLGGAPLDFLRTFREHDNIYFDTSLASPATIMRFVEEVGAERVLFGSDVPFGSIESEIRKIWELELVRGELRLLLKENVEKLFKVR
jgi:predicted TIM-barrel fold metal-dependent hydrolase